MTFKPVSNFNYPDNVSVELGKVFRRNPILTMNSSADSLHLKPRKVVTANLKSQNEPFTTVASVPIPSDLYRVFLVQNRIEDWLFR